MSLTTISTNDALYPKELVLFLKELAPAKLAVIGRPELLVSNKLALFCSVKCPGNLILQAYDLAIALRELRITVISGFHSPMEQECLAVLLRGTQPIIVCPARSLQKMRIRPVWREPIEEGRLLLLSTFAEKLRRATADLARERNQYAAAMAEKVFVAYAAPGSKTEEFCRDVLIWGKPLLTFEGKENSHLVNLGARPISTSKLPSILADTRVTHS
jgi:predicted Rossmann fold nucleotide-binding protein DprA/Smf involved in DNA uptake